MDVPPIKAPSLTRCSEEPLLTPASHSKIGENLNGPCVIRSPFWVPNPLGRFYMYFAHHTGNFIRLAVADRIAGPWQVQDCQPLHLKDTGFAQFDVQWRNDADESLLEPPHIASPDVHIDARRQQVVMFYHGLREDGRQVTAIAKSHDGVNFATEGCSREVTPPYLRVCQIRSRVIGIAWGGEVYSANSLCGPFIKGPPILERPNGPNLIPRHPALVWRKDVLHCFYSLIGDCPERIWHLPITPAEHWNEWTLGTPSAVLAPELDWEGVTRPKVASRIGASEGIEHALRDPYVFEDHVFYAAGGENCIAAARVEWT